MTGREAVNCNFRTSGGDQTDLLRDMVPDVDLLVVQKHAIDGFDGSLSSLSGLIVHKTVALRVTLIVSGDLA